MKGWLHEKGGKRRTPQQIVVMEPQITTADGYFRSAQVLLKASSDLEQVVAHLQAMSPPNRVVAFIPTSFMLTFLAIEIYLKELYRIEHGKMAGKGHDLKHLHSRLSQDSKSRIKTVYEEYQRRNPYQREMTETAKAEGREISWEVEDVLEEMSKSFIPLRYPYEGLPAGLGFRGGQEIALAVRTRIKELRPQAFDSHRK